MKKRIGIFIVLVQLILMCTPISADNAEGYEGFMKRVEGVASEGDILSGGFEMIDDMRFLVEHKNFGLVEFVPSIDRKYGRVVLFFLGEGGEVVFKTDKLESNSWFKGQMKQPNEGIVGVAFRDLNGDGLEDVIIICRCINDAGGYIGKPYAVGEVLFQNGRGFYRDWRISDKINRFGMNKDIHAVTAFVRDGQSMEFLYTAKTEEELLGGGLEIIDEQSFTAYFESLGIVRVISGFYHFGGQNHLILYVVNEGGKIIWNFQPMGDYLNFYSIRGISFTDIDNDGLKDILILANYATYDDEGDAVIKSDYSVYYQQTGFFVEDTEVKRSYPCMEEDNLGTIIRGIRSFWRWDNWPSY